MASKTDSLVAAFLVLASPTAFSICRPSSGPGSCWSIVVYVR